VTVTDALIGRVNDVDGHEVLPISQWGAQFGHLGPLLQALLPEELDTFGIAELRSGVERDDVGITPDSVWRRVGWENNICQAPGAIDMTRREAVLDTMGVRAQQIFPSFGTAGFMLLTATPAFVSSFFKIPAEVIPGEVALAEIGEQVCLAYNNWVLGQMTGIDGDRVRMVGVIPTISFETMMAETERLIAAGIKAVAIPPAVPPAGRSPADRSLDPFWALCERSNVSVQIHGALDRFMATDVWRNIPEFEIESSATAEFIVEPWSMASLHLSAQNFVTTIVLGGVFERHPQLRFGVIECGAHWVGPMAESLDVWARQFKRRMAKLIAMPPSGYVARNIRVSPFVFEPVALYFERYNLGEVYCYGSDYPHHEGGINQLETLREHLRPLGRDIEEKFFVTNAQWIMG